MARYYCWRCERPTGYYSFQDDDGNRLWYCKSCKQEVEELAEQELSLRAVGKELFW